MSVNFRTIILKRLHTLGKSKYWLAEQVQFNPSQNSIYAFLRGERDMRAAHVARLMDVLGLHVVAAPKRS